MNYPDSPTVPFDKLDNVESSDGEAQANASRPVDAERLSALLSQIQIERSSRDDEQPLSRFASPSSSPYLNETEEHLDELSSTTSPQYYDVRDEEPTSEYAPPIDSQHR